MRKSHFERSDQTSEENKPPPPPKVAIFFKFPFEDFLVIFSGSLLSENAAMRHVRSTESCVSAALRAAATDFHM